MSEPTAVPEPTGSGSAVDRFLASVIGGRPAEPGTFAPAAVLDATVPNWRFTVTGGPAVTSAFAGWYAFPATFEELRRLPLPGGELVEFSLRWEEHGVPHAAHQVHLLELGSDGSIAADRAFCGGRWDAALLAEMGAIVDAD